MDKKALIQALRDTAQSASNAIASNVSGPVDLIAAALRGVGLPANNPVGGSQWMAEKGLTREVEMGAPRIVGETLGMVGPALATKFAPKIAGALNQGAANLAAPQTLSKQRGVINWPGAPKEVYHGTGKEFDAFDMSKIQSNTRADDAGIGWHFSDNKSDAGFYADMAARNLGLDKGHVGKWDLDMKNPLVIGIDESDGNIPAELIDVLLNDKFLAKKYAIDNGHDGIIYPYGTNVDSGWTGILFDGKKAVKLK